MYNYNHLYYFYITAKLKGVSKAADFLRISQPSLSIQLKTLENRLGVVLFEKVGRRLVLSQDGERVFDFCNRMFSVSEELDDFVRHSIKGEARRCRIGITSEIERPFIADVLSSILKSSPSQEKPLLSILTHEHKDLKDALAHGELDVALTTQTMNSSSADLLAEVSLPVIAVAHPSILSATQSKLPLLKLLRETSSNLILPSKELRLRFETDMFLQKHKVENAVTFESDILSMVLRAVVEGAGIGFLPKQYMEKEIKQKNLRILNSEQPLWRSRLYLYGRKNKTLDPVTRKIKARFLKL